MFKKQKEIDLKVDELFDRLYEVEGEITDYLSHQMFEGFRTIKDESIKKKMLEQYESGFQIIKKFSEVVCDEIFQFDSEDRYSDDILLEIKNQNRDKYYFLIKFSNITFKCHDVVKIIVLPHAEKNYDHAYAVVNLKNTLLWTGMERGRVESLKFYFGMILVLMFWQTIFIGFIFLFLLFLSWINSDFEGLLETSTIAIVGVNIGIFIIGVLLVGNWWVFATEQDYLGNIYAEAVFKKLGFNAVKFLDLEKYSLLAFNKKSKKEVDYWDEKKQAHTYLLKIALKEHNREYKK